MDLSEALKSSGLFSIIRDGGGDFLLPGRTVKESLTVQFEGNREVQRKVAYYNLYMIISVGYRVKSNRGVEFRRWAIKEDDDNERKHQNKRGV